MRLKVNPPTWSNLRSLGEQRLLRVSYLVFAAIPIWASINSHFSDAAEYAHESMVKFELILVQSMLDQVGKSSKSDSNAAKTIRELKSNLEKWLKSGHLLKDRPSVESAEEMVSALLSESEEHAKKALLAAATAWRNVESAYHLPSRIPNPRLPLLTKLLWFGTLFISMANLIYATRLPAMLSSVHRPERQGVPTGLGDEADFKACAAAAFNGNVHQHLSIVFSNMLFSCLGKEKVDQSGRVDHDRAVLIEQVWLRLQSSRPWARGLCACLYTIGVICVFFWILCQATRVFEG